MSACIRELALAARARADRRATAAPLRTVEGPPVGIDQAEPHRTRYNFAQRTVYGDATDGEHLNLIGAMHEQDAEFIRGAWDDVPALADFALRVTAPETRARIVDVICDERWAMDPQGAADAIVNLLAAGPR